MRRELGLTELPVDVVCSHIGWGARSLVAKSLAEPPGTPDPSAEEIETALHAFRRHYGDCLLDTTLPFPGIPELLEEGGRKGIPMAVVSNKPERFCRMIIAGLGLADHFYTVIGGDTYPRKKPNADPLLGALERALPLPDGRPIPGRAKPENAVMVGDSETDLEAGRAAGCRSVMVSWGLRTVDRLIAHGAETIVHSAGELAGLLWGAGPEAERPSA
jgi:phosphoglycolate phosphatase